MKANLVVALLFSAMFFVGCEDNEGPPPIVLVDSGANNTNNMTDTGNDVTDADMGTANNNNTPDMEFDLPDISTPGFMNGVWLVKDKASGDLVAKLTLIHEDGETKIADGFYEMTLNVDGTDQSFKDKVGASAFEENTFRTSWNARIDNKAETWIVSDAKAESETVLNGMMTSSYSVEFGAVILEKVE